MISGGQPGIVDFNLALQAGPIIFEGCHMTTLRLQSTFRTSSADYQSAKSLREMNVLFLSFFPHLALRLQIAVMAGNSAIQVEVDV